MSEAGVTVVIVNWNAGELLGRCLRSLELAGTALPFKLDVLVVDNASTDGSVDGVERAGKVRVVRNAGNSGFGSACNQGAALATTPYLLFLNPDCELEPGSLAAAREVLAARADVGVAGVALKGRDGHVGRSCHRFPSVWHFIGRALGLTALFPAIPDGSMRDWPHDTSRAVDHVIGAFYLVRTAEFRRLGGFDERFFVYLEDLDLSLRFRQAGLITWFLAEPASFHVGGGTSSKVINKRLFYSTRSRIQYSFKHFPSWQAWLHLVVTLAVEPVVRTIHSLARGQVASAFGVFRAFHMVYCDIKNTCRKQENR